MNSKQKSSPSKPLLYSTQLPILSLSKLLIRNPWSIGWAIDKSLPLWNNIQEVKYPQDSRSEPKQNYQAKGNPKINFCMKNIA